jgi:hypothetical protein
MRRSSAWLAAAIVGRKDARADRMAPARCRISSMPAKESWRKTETPTSENERGRTGEFEFSLFAIDSLHGLRVICGVSFLITYLLLMVLKVSVHFL